MKTKLVLGLCLGFVSTCFAEQMLAQYDWRKLADTSQLLGGVPVIMEAKSALKIENTNDTPLQLQVLKLHKPPISKMLYAIAGEVKYEGVRGNGYLEMWNFYPPLKPGMPEGAYFSRTLGESGEMGKLTGTSNWRRFMLPFDRTGASGPPTRLEMNVFLPAQGTVYLGPIELVEYAGSLNQATSPANAWWSDRTAGLAGGTGGAALGCLASLLAWLASKGRSQSLVVVIAISLILLGGLLTLAGILALCLHQPYAVWFVLLLPGILLLAILPPRLKQFQKQYADLETRKMAALDTLGG
jgi:hypothetical protein